MPFPATAGLMLGPTPLQRADRLGRAVGLDAGQLWVKRDDLTPLGGGGNKVRKLDHLCGAALEADADILVTGGGPQSNHVRLTAAAARHLGLDAVVVFTGDPPAQPSGNLVVDALFEPVVVWTGLASLAELEAAIDAEGSRLTAAGRRPYVIPVGGAHPIGSQGYVAAADEMCGQLAGTPALVVTPAGSGGTQAGLAAGLGRHEAVLGVGVGAFPDLAQRVGRLADEASALAGRPAPTGTPRIDTRYDRAGYGAELEPVREAMHLAARTEGLVLDPVYTGKALAALAAGLAEGSLSPDGPVVFLHCGGAYGLLSTRYSAWAAGSAD
jgi:1-aminocyclopropane-1-carboxylate deaminase/D-cysteine desulfhydrase-like pyridoxal-dependent ACC family enzyme